MDNKVLILDYSKWRCGGNNHKAKTNWVGEGSTGLLNEEGFSCCLGQFTPQLNPDAKDLISLKHYPSDLKIEIPLLNERTYPYTDSPVYFTNTALAKEAVGINDNSKTTPRAKIMRLKKLFAGVGYEIQVINKPKV